MQSFFKISSVPEKITTQKRGVKIHGAIDSLLRHSYPELLPNKNMWSMHKDSLGKPWITFDGKSDLVPVSISHKNQFVFVYAGMFAQYVGVDVEEVRAFSDVLLNGFLTKKERLYLEKAPKSDFFKIATKIWCIKESILKAIGCGFRIRPGRISVLDLLDLQEGEKGVFEIGDETFMCTLMFFGFKNNHVFIGLNLDPSFTRKLSKNMSKEGLLISGDKV